MREMDKNAENKTITWTVNTECILLPMAIGNNAVNKRTLFNFSYMRQEFSVKELLLVGVDHNRWLICVSFNLEIFWFKSTVASSFYFISKLFVTWQRQIFHSLYSPLSFRNKTPNTCWMLTQPICNGKHVRNFAELTYFQNFVSWIKYKQYEPEILHFVTLQ